MLFQDTILDTNSHILPTSLRRQLGKLFVECNVEPCSQQNILKLYSYEIQRSEIPKLAWLL